MCWTCNEINACSVCVMNALSSHCSCLIHCCCGHTGLSGSFVPLLLDFTALLDAAGIANALFSKILVCILLQARASNDLSSQVLPGRLSACLHSIHLGRVSLLRFAVALSCQVAEECAHWASFSHGVMGAGKFTACVLCCRCR